MQDIVSLLDELHVDKAVQMGTSGGGPYACACACLAPQRTQALALVASMTHVTGPGSSELVKGMLLATTDHCCV